MLRPGGGRDPALSEELLCFVWSRERERERNAGEWTRGGKRGKGGEVL